MFPQTIVQFVLLCVYIIAFSPIDANATTATPSNSTEIINNNNINKENASTSSSSTNHMKSVTFAIAITAATIGVGILSVVICKCCTIWQDCKDKINDEQKTKTHDDDTQYATV